LLVAILAFPAAYSTGIWIDFFIKMGTRTQVLTSQRAYEQAMREYDWTVFKETHGEDICATIKSVAMRFPRASECGNIHDAIETMMHKRFLATGTIDIKELSDIIDGASDKVFSPPPEQVCKDC